MLPIMAKAVGYMKPDIDPNTRLYVPFNEGVGSVAKDYSQYCNHAVLMDVTWGIGINGNASIYDGSTSFGDCGNDASLDFGTGAFSFLVRIKTAADGIIIDKYAATGGGGQMNFSINGNKLRGITYNSGVGIDFVGTSVTSTNNNWHPVVFVVDSGGTSARLYLDGIQDGSKTGATAKSVTSDGTLKIGRDTSTRRFTGTIDEGLIIAKTQTSYLILADTYEVAG